MSGWDVKENIVNTNVYKTDGSITTQSLTALSDGAIRGSKLQWGP